MTRYRNLDLCVLEALAFFADLKEKVANGEIDPDKGLKSIKPDPKKAVMVLGSGNAILTGQYIYRNSPAVFANQDDYETVLNRYQPCMCLEQIVIISASGKKDAADIAKKLNESDQYAPRLLLTTNRNAPAAEYVNDIICFPAMDDEPYTYNVSTYMSMLLGTSDEDPAAITRFLEDELEIPNNLGSYSAYYFLVPAEYEHIGEMFNIKFREIFGCHVGGRASTSAHAKHGLFVHPSEEELVVGLGVNNRLHGYSRFNVEIPDLGPARLMALGYYLIGQIQRRKYPWFKLNIDDYRDRVRTLSGWKV